MHIAHFNNGVLKVQEFGNFELSPMESISAIKSKSKCAVKNGFFENIVNIPNWKNSRLFYYVCS